MVIQIQHSCIIYRIQEKTSDLQDRQDSIPVRFRLILDTRFQDRSREKEKKSNKMIEILNYKLNDINIDV